MPSAASDLPLNPEPFATMRKVVVNNGKTAN